MGGVGHVEVRWGGSIRCGGGSCKGGVGHVGWGGSCRGVNNFICHKLEVLFFLLTNYCQLLSG